MARVIGEGLVRVRPDTSGFEREADRGVQAAFAGTVARLGRLTSRLEGAAAQAGQRAGQRFGDGMQRGTSRLASLLPRLFAAAGITVAGAAMASVGAHAIAMTSAVVGSVGAVGLLPGVAFAGAAALGVLGLATRNLGKAFGDTGGSGVGMAAAVEAAQRRLAAAQRDALRAQRDITDARREETERLADLALNVEGARLAEERAARRVAEAQVDLTKAQAAAAPDVDAIAEADLAYREAAHALAEAKDRTKDLAAEQQEATRVGVNGSRAVTDAVTRQRDAAEELAAAQRDLARAGQGGAPSEAAKAYGALAPSAQRLVDVVRELAPGWRRMQQTVQGRVFAGVAGDVRGLSAQWLPMLTRRLGGVAGAFNTAIRTTAGLGRSRAYIADVDTSLGHTALAGDRLARAVAPILSGLRHLGVVATGFLPGMAGGALSVAQRFERWAAAARASGDAQRWITNGVGVLRTLGAVAGNVVGIVAAIFRAGGAEQGRDMLAGLESGTARLKAFLNSTEGQDRISSVLSTLRGIITGLSEVVPVMLGHAAQIGPTLATAASEGGALYDALSLTDVVVGFLADHLGLLGDALPYIIGGFIAYKLVQTASYIAAVASIPVTIGQTRAMRAHTAALRANTAATAAGTAAENRNTLASIRARVATLAKAAADRVGAAGQWLLNIAQSANPLGLIILAIIALVAVIVLLWKKNETFRTVVLAVWHAIQAAIKAVVSWVVDTAVPWLVNAFMRYLNFMLGIAKFFYVTLPLKFAAGVMWILRKSLELREYVIGKFLDIVGFVTSLPGRVKKGAAGMWDAITDGFAKAINWLIDKWNSVDLSVSITLPDWMGGWSWTLPDLFPDIPRLADGGVARARPGGMLANIAEGGQDEVVAPLSTLTAMIVAAVREALAGAAGGVTVENLEIKAFTDRFSLAQVQDELAMHGVV